MKLWLKIDLGCNLLLLGAFGFERPQVANGLAETNVIVVEVEEAAHGEDGHQVQCNQGNLRNYVAEENRADVINYD